MAKRDVGLFGGIFSGVLSILFLAATPLFGVGFLPTATFPYGAILGLLNVVLWAPCLICTQFPSRPLVNFTFLAHVVALLVDVFAFILLLVFGFTSFATAASSALQYGFVLLPLAFITVIKGIVTVALLALVKLY